MSIPDRALKSQVKQRPKQKRPTWFDVDDSGVVRIPCEAAWDVLYFPTRTQGMLPVMCSDRLEDLGVEAGRRAVLCVSKRKGRRRALKGSMDDATAAVRLAISRAWPDAAEREHVWWWVE